MAHGHRNHGIWMPPAFRSPASIEPPMNILDADTTLTHIEQLEELQDRILEELDQLDRRITAILEAHAGRQDDWLTAAG